MTTTYRIQLIHGPFWDVEEGFCKLTIRGKKQTGETIFSAHKDSEIMTPEKMESFDRGSFITNFINNFEKEK